MTAPPMQLDSADGTRRNDEATRRLDVCACVLAVWTRDGADEAALAPRCFGLDAAVDLLEGFVLEADGGDADPLPSVRRFERTPSVAEFTELLLANLPCVFPWDDDDPLWASCADWHAAGLPVPSALLRAYPADTVISAASSSGRSKMTLEQYAISWWTHNVGADGALLDSAAAAPLYCKDLQFCRGPAFTSPRLFDDWLGACYDARRAAEGCGGAVPDLRFVYCGPANTLTPLHCDVWRTHSWSANLCGTKRWLFVAPWEAHKLWDRFGGKHASSFADSCFLFPALRSARVAEVIQHAGEVMFVRARFMDIAALPACVDSRALYISLLAGAVGLVSHRAKRNGSAVGERKLGASMCTLPPLCSPPCSRSLEPAGQRVEPAAPGCARPVRVWRLSAGAAARTSALHIPQLCGRARAAGRRSC